MSELLLRAGDWDAVTPESAGWRYLSFRVETGSFCAARGACAGAADAPKAMSASMTTDTCTLITLPSIVPQRAIDFALL